VADAKKDDNIQHVVEDATGFNLRSLKTLRDLFIRPNTVFRSYAERDRVTYTPALRLWLGIVGIQVIVSALWGGWAGLLRRQIADATPQVREAYEQVSGGQLDVFIDHYADAANLLQPIIVALFTSLSVFLLGAFNRTLAWSSRFNIAMGILAIGSLGGLLLMPLMFVPENASLYAMLAIGGVTLIYFITFLRGAPGVLATTAAGGVVKALIYTAVLVLLVLIAGFVMTIAAVLYATVRMQGQG
jgi:hypothetical protein